ncbi:MAG: hypothetical protein M1818_003020 [Claussenomyces sp. TS43310]|nr:MAG: hypothetical protein M1818_003020 [Claussenomyces sp. TS43310]
MGNESELFHTHQGPINLNSQGEVVGIDYPHDLFNDYGFVVRARADTGEDIHLWMFMYRQRGREVIQDNDVMQTLCVHGKFGDTDVGMKDLPYINEGQNFDDYNKPGTIQIQSTDKEAVWACKDRTFTCRPPFWYIKGEHAGVTVDLEFRQRGDAFYHCGLFENLKDDAGLAGYVVHARVKGTISIKGGSTLNISNGHGTQERIILAKNIPPRLDYMKGGGQNWLHGWGDKLSWYILTGDIGSHSTFMLNVGDKTYTATGSATYQEIGRWLDPLTNQINPCKWRVVAQTSAGQLEAIVTGHSRAYYTWTRASGTVLVHQFLCKAEAKFTAKDGEVTEESQVASLEYMRTLYRQYSL